MVLQSRLVRTRDGSAMWLALPFLLPVGQFCFQCFLLLAFIATHKSPQIIQKSCTTNHPQLPIHKIIHNPEVIHKIIPKSKIIYTKVYKFFQKSKKKKTKPQPPLPSRLPWPIPPPGFPSRLQNVLGVTWTNLIHLFFDPTIVSWFVLHSFMHREKKYQTSRNQPASS